MPAWRGIRIKGSAKGRAVIEQLKSTIDATWDELSEVVQHHYGLAFGPGEVDARIVLTLDKYFQYKLPGYLEKMGNPFANSDLQPVDHRVAIAVLSLSLAERDDELVQVVGDLMFAANAIGSIRADPHPVSVSSDKELKMVSKFATALAERRHIENRQLAAYAIEYWEKSIDKKLSAQKAADLLISQVNLSHKKLADLVAAERKKQGLSTRQRKA